MGELLRVVAHVEGAADGDGLVRVVRAWERFSG